MSLIDLLDLSQSVLDGVLFGATYALIGIGFTLIFGVANLINFSHGSVFMVGAYVGWWLAAGLGWPFLALLPVVILVSAALGIAIERFQQLDIEGLLLGIRPQARRREEDEEHHRRERAQQARQSQLLVGTLLGLGAGSIVYGSARYFSNLRLLERGEFRPAYHGAAVLAAAVAGLAGGVYGSALRRRWEGDGERSDVL